MSAENNVEVILPEPSYIDYCGDLWVGIQDNDESFLFWRNVEADLTKEKDRDDIAAFITRLKVQHGIVAKLGSPIDLNSSSSISGTIAKINSNDQLGIYFPFRKRQFNNMRIELDGLKSEDELREKFPNEFEQTYQEVLKALPQA